MTSVDGLRPSFYRRLHRLLPFASLRVVLGLWRALVWSFWLIYFGFVVLVLVLRYGVLPNIESYRLDIERLARQGLGQNISIGRIEASWEGINPDLTLLDVRVADAEGRPALAFSRIEAILSWWSVPSAQLKLRLLRIDEPTLNLRRDGQGHFFIAGIPLGQEQGGNTVSDWVLAQKRIRIRGATVVWEDALRNAPALVLEDLNLALDNDGKNHRFGMTALPPEAFASRIDVRGDFRGTDLEQLALWSGQAYGQIDYADLAIWRQWIDYPVNLPHGRGALRTWVRFADGDLRGITADIALEGVGLQLAQDLPLLEVDRLSGRLGANFSAKGVEANGRRIELVTHAVTTQNNESRETIHLEPTDFHVDWQPALDGKTFAGAASATRLNIGVLARLAEHVPLDTQSRKLLNEFAPSGHVSGLNVKWKGSADRLQAYSLKTGFDDLTLKAQEPFPGFSGLSGTLEASESGGAVTVRSLHSTLDLPSVFPVPLVELDSLGAQATWKINKGGLEAELAHVEFSGKEAAGSAQGTYRTAGDGPGSIDLTASLTRGDARAVWRYMPHAVGAGARQWLKDSLLAGHASEAKLVLKGNLLDFPFLDKKKGQFLVTVKAHDVVLDYGKGWPRIDGIDGDLRFEGNGMIVDAQRGSILGAKLSKTRAEIPDFDKPISTLHVKGQADGPTAEFLKFIDQSPVAERIDRFTEDMRANGAGHLDIALLIPLDEAKLGDSKIDGTYRLINNEVTVDTALPPLKQVSGSVQFSGSDLRVPEINATLFGGPLKIKGGLQKDGKVLITANGSVNIAQLRKQSDSPFLENVSGTTLYRGEVRINKRNADLLIESSLVGLGSTFPEPFGKAVGEIMPLRFEKELLAGASPSKGGAPEVPARDRISVSLATAGAPTVVQMVRRKQPEGFVVERGAIAIGRPLVMPEAGISLGVTAKNLDLDSWRRFLNAGIAGKAGEGNLSSSPVNAVQVKTPDLLLMGRHYSDVDLSGNASPGLWKIRMASTQASGDLQWDTAGRGKLTARLKQLSLDPSAATKEADAGEAIKELPGLDIVADEFSVANRQFGRLELQARNEAGVWTLNKINATNPNGTLSGSGQWHVAGGRNRTQLSFRIDSNDVGKLLERVGYPGTVRAGTAQLEGKLGWNGTPVDLDYGTLSGEMNLNAGKGQFLKLDPGAAGKLLGLISLQGLPRRISFDFKDVFSEGFAFDSIASKMAVQNGLMRTDRLQIDGPSARVLMRGEVDLKHETQNLNVNVQPELGGTAALGIGLINPVAGVATWVAHKILQNPLNHIFGFEYLVTGSWDDPKVEKVSRTDPQAATPRLPTIPNSTGFANEPTSK